MNSILKIQCIKSADKSIEHQPLNRKKMCQEYNFTSKWTDQSRSTLSMDARKGNFFLQSFFFIWK